MPRMPPPILLVRWLCQTSARKKEGMDTLLMQQMIALGPLFSFCFFWGGWGTLVDDRTSRCYDRETDGNPSIYLI